MIGQISGYALNGYILNPGVAKDHFGSLFGADPSLAENLAVFAKTSIYIGRSCKTDQYSCDDKDVGGIKIRIKEWHNKSLLSMIGYTGMAHNTQTCNGIY